MVDIVRGALDAHIHPNLEGTEPAPWTHQVPGLLALTAGLIWSGLTLSIALRPEPYYESGGIVAVFMFAAFFSLPGDYMAGHGRQIAIGIGACTACFVLANVAGWNPVGLGLMLLGYLIAICGPLVLAAIRAGIGPRGRWLLLAWSVLVPTVAAVGDKRLPECQRHRCCLRWFACDGNAPAALRTRLGRRRAADDRPRGANPRHSPTRSRRSTAGGPRCMNRPLGDLGGFAEPSLYILVSLAAGPKHGYAIMTDVEEVSGSPMGPGTLYGALARLESQGPDRGARARGSATTVPAHRSRLDKSSRLSCGA